MTQTHYSAAELAGYPGLPTTKKGVLNVAARENWPSQPRAGRGGGREYPLSCLPKETQQALIERALAAHTPAANPVGAVPAVAAGSLPAARRATHVTSAEPSSFGVLVTPGTAPTRLASALPARLPAAGRASDLTDEQRQQAAARMALLQAVEQLHLTGAPVQTACEVIARNASRGALAPDLQALVPLANARGEALSARTIMRWRQFLRAADPANTDAQIAALAPIVPVKKLDLPPDVLGVIAQLDTSGNSLSAACRAYARANGLIHDQAAVNQLYHRASRALKDKVPASVMHKRRHSGAGLTAKKPYITRDASKLLPNDVWVTDGHSMKAKWAHPETGKPFVPEFTVVEDWGTRRVLGWSIALSENSLAVREALLNAVRDHGVPGIVYSDGGAGQTARDMDDPVRGFYATFGIDHRTGRPGNPQGRGVIERAWASHAMLVAQENPLFRGGTVDRDTLRRNSIALDKSLRAAARDSSNVVPISQLPSFQQLIDSLHSAVAEYNARPHRGLPKNAATGQHYSPDQYWQERALDPDCAIERVSLDAQRLMFMPYQLKPASRGRVRLFGNYYGHPDLYLLADDKHVRVHYDVCDPRAVWIADINGRYLCQAAIDANTRDAFPMSVVESTRLRRINNKMKRLQAKASDLTEEADGINRYSREAFATPEPLVLPPADAAPADADNVVPIGAEPARAARPLFADSAERYRWLMVNRGEWLRADHRWVAAYVETVDYADLAEIFESEGIAWPPPDYVGGADDEGFRGAAA